MILVCVIFCAYLLGSIPFGFLFVRWSGKGDVREIGSGNIGTTNVLRTGSRKLAAATLLADFGKGVLAVAMAYQLQKHGESLVFLPHVAAFFAIFGHIFPVWIQFKGGKGVATALGVFCALNIFFGLSLILIWLAAAKLMRISSLSALISFALSPFISLVIPGYNLPLTILSSVVAVLVLWTHRDNIKRLTKGEESTMNLEE